MIALPAQRAIFSETSKNEYVEFFSQKAKTVKKNLLRLPYSYRKVIASLQQLSFLLFRTTKLEQ